MVFFLSTYIFFWSLVFLVPTPVIYRIGDILKDQEAIKSVSDETLAKAVSESKRTNNDDTIIFDANVESKRSSALFLISIITFVIIFFQIIIFNKKSHILFPMVTATVVAYIFYSCIWQFMNSMPKALYVDLYLTRIQNEGLKAIQFLGVYIVIFGLILIFGNWSRLTDIK